MLELVNELESWLTGLKNHLSLLYGGKYAQEKLLRRTHFYLRKLYTKAVLIADRCNNFDAVKTLCHSFVDRGAIIYPFYCCMAAFSRNVNIF